MLSTAAGYRLVTGDGAEPEPSVEVDGVVYHVARPHELAVPRRRRPAYVATPRSLPTPSLSASPRSTRGAAGRR